MKRGISRSEMKNQKRNDPEPAHPHKYAIKPCHSSKCMLVDKAILHCWCDPSENELKRFHNEWVDVLDSPNVTLDKIAEMDEECYEKYSMRLYKRPTTGWGKVDWSNFDFSEMGHLVAVMGKFFLKTYSALRLNFKATHFRIQKEVKLSGNPSKVT